MNEILERSARTPRRTAWTVGLDHHFYLRTATITVYADDAKQAEERAKAVLAEFMEATIFGLIDDASEYEPFEIEPTDEHTLPNDDRAFRATVTFTDTDDAGNPTRRTSMDFVRYFPEEA